MLDTVRDSLETCFYSWDYHILHHFGYSFEVGFRVSHLRHWSVLYSDFLADYCWAEDSWLMMLDSLFGCALDIHTRAYPPLFSKISICYWTAWLSLFMVIEMFGWFWQTLYYALDYPHWGIFPSPWWDCVWVVVRGWMIIVCCSPHDFDTGSYTGAYSPIFLEYPWVWDSSQFGFRLSTSLELSMIDCIKTPYMDLLR